MPRPPRTLPPSRRRFARRRLGVVVVTVLSLTAVAPATAPAVTGRAGPGEGSAEWLVEGAADAIEDFEPLPVPVAADPVPSPRRPSPTGSARTRLVPAEGVLWTGWVAPDAPAVLAVPADGEPGALGAVVVQVLARSADGPVAVRLGPDAATVAAQAPSVVLPAGGGETITSVTTRVAADGTVVVAADGPVEVTLALEARAVGVDGPVAAGRVQLVEPAVVVDTTRSVGAPGRLAAGQVVRVALAGPGRVLPAGTAAALVQLTVTDGLPPGRVVAWSGTGDVPPLGQVSVPGFGATATNLALVPLAADGTVAVAAGTPVELRVEVVAGLSGSDGPVGEDGLLVPVTPWRALDVAVPLEARLRTDVAVTGPPVPGGVAVGAALVRVGTAGSSDGGRLTIGPAGADRRLAVPVPVLDAGGATSSPMAVRLGVAGAASLWPDARTGVSLDVVGWLTGTPAPRDPAVPAVAATAEGTPSGAATAVADAWVNGFLATRRVAGLSIAVSRNGQVVYARGAGTADPSTGAPVRVDSRFRYASVSKVLTAATVLQLVQAGALGLDDGVLGVLGRRIEVPADPDRRLGRITVRHLLQHTSGYATQPDPFFVEQGGAQVAPGGATSCAQAAAWALRRGPSGEPGRAFAYANVNYCLLGLVVEAVTGESYEAAVQRRTLAPSGVRDAVLGRSRVRFPGEVSHNRTARGAYMEALEGAGGWVGTAVDLVRVVDGLDPARPGPALLRPDMAALLTAPTPGQVDGFPWGLGVAIYGGPRDRGTWGHTGSLAGARSMVVHRSDGMTWAITVNGDLPSQQSILQLLGDRVADSLRDAPAGDYGPDLP
jgi:D-alanyl-D-alanine carboxypeptidase